MDLKQLIEGLRQPKAFLEAVTEVEVLQTHISVVFLAGSLAFKIKKPVNLGFLDFTTLDRRRHYCEEEVRLNRRLAPSVYLGVVPVTEAEDGLRFDGMGQIIEWAVKMVRLPESATLLKRLESGEVDRDLITNVAQRIAHFHREAQSGKQISAFGRFEGISRNALENFVQSASQIGTTISQSVFDRLRELTEESLSRGRLLIEARARAQVPRDTHGDLHLDHVYLFPDRKPPDNLVIVDCIEFNERFRFADPVSDMAFIVMDLSFHARADLATTFADAYFAAARDADGRQLLPLYTSYRAAVRAKVEGFASAETEIPEKDRTHAIQSARAHWLLALRTLETPRRQAGIVLVGGLQGSGKSTLARALAETANFTVIRSDVVRKELTQDINQPPIGVPYGEGIYSPEWTERTYAECLRRTTALLFEAKRVIVDATFSSDDHRRSFVRAAKELCVPAIFIECQAPPNIVQGRLAARSGDISDADWSIYEQSHRSWQPVAADIACIHRTINTTATVLENVARAEVILTEFGLWD